MNKLQYQAQQMYGDVPANELEALAHTLAVYADTPDSRMVVTATSNVYGDGVTTGLTFGDLRKIAERLALPSDYGQALRDAREI